jgi:filamin
MTNLCMCEGIEVRNLEGSVTSPSGTMERCEVVDIGNGRFTIKFVPKEIGVHTVSLKYNGLHIPGKLFQAY